MSEHLPNLVVVGAMKAGTTSLHRYLAIHPEVWMSRQKELDFFIELRNWDRGINWYASHFQEEAFIRGESSPGYTNYPYHDKVPQRMHSLIPDAKLIYILRNPLERIISDYLHRFRKKSERRSIQDALGGEDTKGYVNRSCYFLQISQYLGFYPMERILIITQEELLAKRIGTLKRVFRFLEIDESFKSKEFTKLFHRSGGKPRLNKVGRILSSA
ncbi:MAG: sulfotransferase [Desulfobacteraceae bacterium]|nr:sulfotransferase [Desulfobacteraceae bacterium]